MQSLHATASESLVEKRLHHIALRYIFESLFPPAEEDLLDYSLCRGPDSFWCRRLRTKKALLLVSRKWRLSAAPFLYRDVVIRRVSSLLAFADRLRKNPHYGAMVHILRLDCFIPKSKNKISGDSICFILDNCPNLRNLYFGGFLVVSYFTKGWAEAKFDDASADAVIRAVSRKSATLRTLAFDVDYPDSHYFPPITLLNQTSRLVSLTLSTPKRLGDGTGVLSFPDLKELRVVLSRGYLSGEAVNIRFLTKWELPSLVSLGVFARLDLSVQGRLFDDFWKVLQVHGSNLQFLDYSACRLFVQQPDRDLNQICPQLRHLVLSNKSPKWPRFRSNVLHVDIWTCAESVNWEVTPTVQGDYEVMRRKATSLGCGSLRYLSEGLHVFPRLPTILPPRIESGAPADDPSDTLPYRVHDIFGMRILELGSGLLLEDEYPTEYESFLWRDITPIPGPWNDLDTDPSDSESESTDSTSDDESWTWDEPQIEPVSSDQDSFV